MSDVKTLSPGQIEALTGKELVEHYNDLATFLGKEPVRRFADRATGLKRTLDLALQVKKAKAPPKASTMPTIDTLGLGKKATPAPKPAAKTARNVRRGTNLTPLGHEPIACREGSKQAALLDMLCNPKGATMDELIAGLAGRNKAWTEVTVRSGFGWDLKNKGYGVRSSFDADNVERFHIVLPEKFPKIPNHTPLKTAKPKADARQSRLV